MSWSNQRPQRLALHKNDQAVEVWKKDARPEIKKIRELNATLALEDDAGFSMVSPVKRTWSRQGQTLVFRASLDHHERLNLFGVLLVSPKARKIYLSVKSYWDTLTGDKVITFLKQILHLVHRHIVLVWDRHPIHRRALVKEFIQTHKRLHVFEFPVAAPELNPAEYIWTQTKEYTAGTAPHDNTNYKQMFLRALPAPALLRNVYWPVCETLKSTGSIN